MLLFLQELPQLKNLVHYFAETWRDDAPRF